MKEYYPLHIDLANKKIVIVGGGAVATRKVKGFLTSHAQIQVISPEITGELSRLAQAGEIIWKEKGFNPADLQDAFLIIAATNDYETNELVRASAEKNQLINAADEFEKSNCIVPSIIKRGKLTLSISTSGASPILTKKLRQNLEETFDERYEEYIDFLAECRKMIAKLVQDPGKKREILKAIVEDPRFLDSENRDHLFRQLLKE